MSTAKSNKGKEDLNAEITKLREQLEEAKAEAEQFKNLRTLNEALREQLKTREAERDQLSKLLNEVEYGQRRRQLDDGSLDLKPTSSETLYAFKDQADPYSAKSSAEISALLAATPAGIIVLSEKGKIKSVNKRMLRMTGHTAYDLIGKEIGIFFPEATDTTQLLEKLLQSASRTGIEVQLVNSFGTTFRAGLAMNAKDKQNEIVVCVVELSTKGF